MLRQIETPRQSGSEAALGPDFTRRIELSLQTADGVRRRRAILRFVRLVIPLAVLAAPILGWRLMLASPDGVHVTIEALAWVTFTLDVGVHLDTVLLSHLGLQALPAIVGALLLALVTAWLLGAPEDEA